MFNKINLFKIQNYYTTVQKPFDIDGTLVEKNKNKVCIDLGNNKIAQAVLKDRINERVGDFISIDKSQIISLKIYDKQKNDNIQNEEISDTSSMSFLNENMDIAKALEEFDIPVDENSIESMIASKKYFKIIQQELNHDVAAKLMDSDVDLENDSIEKVATKIEEIKEDEKSYWSLFKKKDLTTEEAEKIAKKIYGNEMGKDITDAIKALHKAKIPITKNNVERIYDIFYKLEKLKNLSDENIVSLYKENKVFSIENLYHIKEGIKEGEIQSFNELSSFATKMYEDRMNPLFTQKSLVGIKDKIIDYLKEIGVLPTEETIKIAELLLKSGISIGKEKINNLLNMKESFHGFKNNINQEKACKIEKNGWNIEKTDIRVINQLMDQNDVDIYYEDMKNMSSQEMIVGISKVNYIHDIFNKIENVNFNQIAFQMKNNIPFTLSQIKKTYTEMKNKEINLSFNEKEYVQKNIEEQKILNHKELSLKINNIQSAGEGLYNNGLAISIVNVKKAIEIYETYAKVRKNISSSMILDGMKEKMNLENIEIQKIDEYTKEKMTEQNSKQKDLIDEVKKVQQYTEIFKNIGEENKIFSLMYKNHLDFSLKEIAKMTLFLKNQKQLGQTLGEMIKGLNEIGHPLMKEHLIKLKNLSKDISKKLKEGIFEENLYDEFINSMENMKEDMNFDQENKKWKDQIQSIMDIQNRLKNNGIAMQLPVWMNDECKNLQIYTQNKNINKNSLNTFLQLDTNTLGQLKMDLKIDQKNITLKIEVKDQEQRKKLEKQISYLKNQCKEIGYDVEEILFISSLHRMNNDSDKAFSTRI